MTIIDLADNNFSSITVKMFLSFELSTRHSVFLVCLIWGQFVKTFNKFSSNCSNQGNYSKLQTYEGEANFRSKLSESVKCFDYFYFKPTKVSKTKKCLNVCLRPAIDEHKHSKLKTYKDLRSMTFCLVISWVSKVFWLF